MGRVAAYDTMTPLTLIPPDRASLKALGPFDTLAFDNEGKYLFASNKDRGVLFDAATGAVIAERPGASLAHASFLSGGAKLLEQSDVAARLSELPSLRVLIDAQAGFGHASDVDAKRLAYAHGDMGTDERPKLAVFDLDTGKQIADVPLGSGWLEAPNIGFSPDGTKVGWAMGGVEVLDLRTKKWTVLERGEAPDHPRYAPSRPYFTADGRHVCVVQEGSVRVLPSISPRAGSRTQCFVRGSQAALVDVPVGRTFTPVGSLRGLYYNINAEALSPDGRVAAIIEERMPVKGAKKGPVPMQIALYDVASKKARLTIPLPARPPDVVFTELSVSFSRDGQIVSVVGNLEGVSGNFSVSTGAPVPDSALEAMTEEDIDALAPRSDAFTDGSLAATVRAAGLVELPEKQAKAIVVGVESKGGKLVAKLAAPAGAEPKVVSIEGAYAAYSLKGFGVAAGGRALLLLFQDGIVTAHSLVDGELIALIAPLSPTNAAAFLADGTFELRGEGPTDALRCRDGDRLDPFDVCRASWAGRRALVRALVGDTKGPPPR